MLAEGMDMANERKFLIDEIVALEWEMFSSVNNIGGRSTCQDQRDTFEIMRRCNLLTWPTAALSSYRADLYAALEEGRNTMTEKYARMMESTSPEEYEAIARFLPPVSDEVNQLVERAACVLVPWEEEMRAKYPFIAARGRGLSDDAGPGVKTSFETYLRAELKTYSAETLRAYVAYLEETADAGVNGSKSVYQNMVRMYGYESLEQASRAMGGK